MILGDFFLEETVLTRNALARSSDIDDLCRAGASVVPAARSDARPWN
jgi:hypothetical protein